MYCSQCGNLLSQNAVFCSKCGMRLTPPAPSQGPTYTPPSPPPYKPEIRRSDLVQRPAIITVLAVLDILAAIVSLGGTGVLLYYSQKQNNFVLAGVAAFCFLLALLYIFAAVGMFGLKSYGRITQLIFSWIGLIGFPLGTIISILILVYLYKPEIKILFSGRDTQQLSAQEAATLERFWESSASPAAVIAAVAGAMVVMIAVLGIIAAIAVPNLLTAIQRGKQKRTLADMRAIATAVEAFAVDKNYYPRAQSMSELATFLQPAYIRVMPLKDAWEHEFAYVSWDDAGSENPSQYVLVSPGKDGAFEHESISDYKEAATTDFNNDIVFANGTFFQYPEGSVK